MVSLPFESALKQGNSSINCSKLGINLEYLNIRKEFEKLQVILLPMIGEEDLLIDRLLYHIINFDTTMTTALQIKKRYHLKKIFKVFTPHLKSILNEEELNLILLLIEDGEWL